MPISRRTFCESVAAAFGAMTLGVSLPPTQRSAAAETINYDLFTDPGIIRYDVADPWSDDGRVVASNGQVLVCHDGHYDGESDARVPDLSHLQWDLFDEGGWQSSATIERFRVTDNDRWAICAECIDGVVPARSLQEMRRCPTCKGLCGWVGAEQSCDDCVHGWLGAVLCGACLGGGDILAPSYRYALGGGAFSPSFIRCIQSLGEFDWRVYEQVIKGQGPTSLLAFRWGKTGRGFLFGMVPMANRTRRN